MYKCRDVISDELVAIKKYKKEYHSMDDALALREVKFLQSVQHCNIIDTIRVEVEAGKLYIVFECMDMNLTTFMKEKA